MHRTGLTALLFACLGLLASGPVPAAAAAPTALAPGDRVQGFSLARLGRLHAYMEQATGPGGYLGAVTLVARAGKTVDWRAHGHRDLARRLPMQRDSIFRIYSMTKPLTSVAVLQLVEQGKITLEDPVSRYLPELARLQVLEGGTAESPRLRAPAGAVTIHALLTHTAGFPAGLPGDTEAGRLQERADPHGAATLQEFVQRLARAPLAADPGKRFGYDAAGTEVLARLVEVVSGQGFDAYLQQHVFQPIGMPDTGFRVEVGKRGRIVDITRMQANGALAIAEGPSAIQPGEPLNRYDSGAGGLYSTAGDFGRFCQMLLDGGVIDGTVVLGRKTVDLMMANHLGMLDPPVTQFNASEGFGLGGYVVTDIARRGQPGSNGQFGWSGAASTYFMVDREERMFTLLLLQHIPGDAAAELPRIHRNFQGLVYQALVP